MANGKYILDDDGKPVECEDLMQWSRWFEVIANRRLAEDLVGDVRVSTVFLALDHNWSDAGPPVLWETMIFGGKTDEFDDWCERYTNRDAAMEGHAKALALVRAAPPPEGGEEE